MVRVEFLGPIEKESIEVEVSSLEELKDLLNKDNELKKWLKISAVAVNDKLVTNSDIKLNDGDKIAILPPVCGG